MACVSKASQPSFLLMRAWVSITRVYVPGASSGPPGALWSTTIFPRAGFIRGLLIKKIYSLPG